MCSVVQYPPTAACSRGCRDCSWRRPAVLWLVLASGRDLRWPPMTSGAPTPSIQSGPGSAARVTCPVSCVTCDVLQSGDVEMWREAIKLCSSSPQHSYLLRIENMRCWETAVGETLRQWDWAEPEMRREILYLGAGVRGHWPVCDVSSLWRGDGTWRQRDGLMIRYKEIFLTRKCGHQFYFCFCHWTSAESYCFEADQIGLSERSSTARWSRWSSPIVTSMYSTVLSHHPSRPFWTSIPI